MHQSTCLLVAPRSYGPSADVYSFGIVLFQIATRRWPFDHVKSHFRLRSLVEQGERPCVLPSDAVPSGLLDLMQLCWQADAASRPSFSEIGFTLSLPTTIPARS